MIERILFDNGRTGESFWELLQRRQNLILRQPSVAAGRNRSVVPRQTKRVRCVLAA